MTTMATRQEGARAAYAAVRSRVAAVCRAHDRRPEDVRIVAVSKTVPLPVVEAVAGAGQRAFGENRAGEFTARVAARPDLQWHFVGQLQSNKAADVAAGATMVHSVDRSSLARRLSRAADAGGFTLEVLAQVNVGRDPAKGGCAPEDGPALLDEVARLPGLRCTGLMTIPPQDDDPRRHFARLRELRGAWGADHPGLTELSMGMSDDLDAAVAEGATIVRPGRAIFGARPPVGAGTEHHQQA